MKRYKTVFNVLFICICVFGIITFALAIAPCQNQFDQYNICKITYNEYPDMRTDSALSYMNGFLYRAIQCIFIAIFSALSAVASGAVLVILNLTNAKNAIFMQSQLTKQRKAAKEQAKAERAEADKQKAIAEKQQQLERLQSELQELKND